MFKKLLVLMMLLIPFVGVQAQADTHGIDYCAILPQADCQILLNSEAVMEDVHALAFELSMELDVPAEGTDEATTVTINGGGSISVDPDTLRDARDLAKEPEEMPEEMMGELPAMLDSFIAGIEGEISLNLKTITDDETVEAPINLVMKDGVFALDIASLGELSGETMEGMEWLGIDLDGAIENLMANPETASQIDLASISRMMGADKSDLTETMTITRLPDSEVNGVSVAVFETLIDYAAMLATADETEATLAEMYTAMGMEQAQIDELMAMLKGMNIAMRTYIGVADVYVHRIEVSLLSEMALEKTMMSVEIAIDLSDFNQPVDVEIPVEALVLPFFMLMGMGG